MGFRASKGSGVQHFVHVSITFEIFQQEIEISSHLSKTWKYLKKSEGFCENFVKFAFEIHIEIFVPVPSW